MLELGEIKSARELGYKCSNKVQWVACPDCGKEHWAWLDRRRPNISCCHSCIMKRKNWVGSNHPAWKGGRKIWNGYVMVYLQPDDFFRSMADCNGFVREHRLVVAKRLGRCLHSWEIVHHKDHIRDHNVDDNLQLVSDDRHKQISILEAKLNKLLKGQDDLKKEIRLLRFENKQLREELCYQIH